MRSKLAACEAVADAVPAFLRNSDQVTLAEFRDYAHAILQRHAELRSIAWTPRVLQSERAQFEADRRAEGLADFEIRDLVESSGPVYTFSHPTRAEVRSDYFPVAFNEPATAAEYLGVDITRLRVNWQRMRTAIDNGAPVASPPYRVDGQPELFLTVYAPVFPRGLQLDSVERRRGAVVGVGQVTMKLFEVMPQLQHDANGTADPVAVELTDLGVAESQRVLYVTDRVRLNALREAHGWERRDRITFAGRTWQLTVIADVSAYTNPWLARLTALFCIALTLASALALGARSLVRQLMAEVDRAQRLGPYTLVEKIGSGGMGGSGARSICSSSAQRR